MQEGRQKSALRFGQGAKKQPILMDGLQMCRYFFALWTGGTIVEQAFFQKKSESSVPTLA